MIRALIVDDEPLGRRRLHTLLADEPDVQVVGACTNGEEAVAAIHALAPDLVFLDVQMPLRDGFGVVEAVGPAHMPAVIFVTAYDQYALRAFEVHALDYLLKPFDRDRFREALAHARTHLQHRDLGVLRDRLASLLARTATPLPPERLAVRTGGRVHFVDVHRIDWIEAAGNYATLHVGPRTHLLRTTMARLEARLDPDAFLRIHRSRIVNVARIATVHLRDDGGYVVHLHDGTRLGAGRSYRPALRALMDRLA